MNLLMLARFLSTCVQTTFRLTSAFLWLVLIRLELFLVFFPILNNQQKQSYSINLYYLRKQMSQKLVIIRNYQTQVRQTASYVQQRSDSIQEPGLVMYQCLRSIVRKQSRYPFQLLKQYILFSDQESSIEVGYKHMRHQLELIQVNLKAFCSLMRQKMLVAGFLAIKHDYQKQLRVEAAYGNIQNIETLTQSIGAVSNLHRLWLQWQFFGKLYENYKGFKLSKINLSKIDLINNDYTSKELMEFEPFLSDKIEVINSFIIDKNSEHNYEEEVEVQEDEIVVQRLNVEKKSQVKSYAFKDDRVISQRSVGKVTPATDKQSNQKQVDDLSSKIFVTHKKESGLLQHMSNNKYRTDAKQKQYIYLIRDYRQRRGTPSNYIKIPVNTENVEIVEVHTQKKKKKKSRRVEIEEFCLTQNNCQNCKFCSQYRERREIMKTVTQKLEIIRSTTTNTVGEIRSDFLGEFSQNDTEGKSSSYYKSAHTAYTHLQFSAK